MANALEPTSSSRFSLSRVSLGPKLIGAGVGVIVLTRVVKWLPLGFLGTWVNGLLWPVALISIVAGGVMMYLKSKRS